MLHPRDTSTFTRNQLKKKKKTRDEMPIALSPKDRLIPFLRGAGTKDTASISLS